MSIADQRDLALVWALAAGSDILVENFNAGDLKRYGLDCGGLRAANPKLTYCAIWGFGQTRPNAHRAGYDFLAQGEAGFMSLTGAPDGPPTKAGVGIADILCWMYAAVGTLAAV